jgi:hypothetical protein
VLFYVDVVVVILTLVLPPVESSSPLPSSYWESFDLLRRDISRRGNCAVVAAAVLSGDREEWRGILLGGGRGKASDAVVQ